MARREGGYVFSAGKWGRRNGGKGRGEEIRLAVLLSEPIARRAPPIALISIRRKKEDCAKGKKWYRPVHFSNQGNAKGGKPVRLNFPRKKGEKSWEGGREALPAVSRGNRGAAGNPNLGSQATKRKKEPFANGGEGERKEKNRRPLPSSRPRRPCFSSPLTSTP